MTTRARRPGSRTGGDSSTTQRIEMTKWIDTIAAVQYAAMDKARDPRAFEVAAQPPSSHDLTGFERARQCLLVTFTLWPAHAQPGEPRNR